MGRPKFQPVRRSSLNIHKIRTRERSFSRFDECENVSLKERAMADGRQSTAWDKLLGASLRGQQRSGKEGIFVIYIFLWISLMFLWFNCTLESLPYGKIVLCQNLSPEPWSTIFQQLTLLIYPFDLIRTLFVKVFEFNKD